MWMESVGPGFPHVIPEVFYQEAGSERRYPDGSNLRKRHAVPDLHH